MERRSSRASILKRKSLNQSILNESLSDITTTTASSNKDPKRVSFHSSNFVKPFASDPEKFTIWDNTYEEAANNTDSTKSNENTDAGMSQISGTSSIHIHECENATNVKSFCDVLISTGKSKAKVKVTTDVEEYEKENYAPIVHMSLNTSRIEMDMSLCSRETTKIGLGTSSTYENRPIQENTAEYKNLEINMTGTNNHEGTIGDFTCIYENRPIQEKVSENENINFTNLEINMPETNNHEGTIGDFTCIYENRPIQEKAPENENMNFPNLKKNMPEVNTELGNRDNLEITADMELTNVFSPEIVCSHRVIEQNQVLKASSREHNQGNITSAMDFTCALSNDQNINSIMDITCASSNNQNIVSTMDITCAPININNITSAMDFTCASSNNQKNNLAPDFTYAPFNKQDISLVMDITCSPSNKQDIYSVMAIEQNIPSPLDFTCAPHSTVMDFTCVDSNKECNTSELVNIDIKKKKDEAASNLKNYSLEDEMITHNDALPDKPVQDEFNIKLANEQITNSKIEPSSDSLDILNKDSSSINRKSTLIVESTNLTNKIEIQHDFKIFNDSNQISEPPTKQPRTRSESKLQKVTTKQLTERKVIESLNTDFSSQPNNPKLPETISIDSKRKSILKTKLKSKSNSDNKDITFTELNQLEDTYTIKKVLDLIDNKDDSHNAGDLGLQSHPDAVLTPKTLNTLKMVNTPGTSFALTYDNSFGTKPLEKPIFTSNARNGEYFDSQKPTEVSSTNNLAEADLMYDHCSAKNLADIDKFNGDCSLFNTTPLLAMSPDRLDSPDPLELFEKNAMKNNFGLLQDSVNKYKINSETDGTDQKSLEYFKSEYTTVPNSIDLILEKVRERVSRPQTLFDDIPDKTLHLITRLEKTHERVLHLVENFKVPDIVIIDLEDLDKLENGYGESSISRLSDGLLCSSTAENNSADDADFEVPKSLEERLQEQAKRSIKYWQFVKCVDNKCYCFYTFYKAVPFKVHVDSNSGIVQEIETFVNLIDNALPPYFYKARFMQEKLKKDNLVLALGSNFDILTLLDYVVMCMEEIKAFDKEYDDLENDFGQEHRLTMHPDFSITIEIISTEFILWWVITVDMSINQLGCIIGARAHHNEFADEPVNEEIIKQIAQNIEGPLFIRNFINKINHYVKREGSKRLAQRTDDLKKKYTFLNL